MPYRKNTRVGKTTPNPPKKAAAPVKKTAQAVHTSRGNGQTLTIKQGRLWTYVYNQDGSLIAEIRNDAIRLVSDATAARLAVAS